MRSGVALLLTLLFIAAVMVLVAGYLQLRRELPRSAHYYRMVAEDDLLVRDLGRLLGRYRVSESAQLDSLLLQTPMIGSEDGAFLVSFGVDNPQSRININLAASRHAGKYLGAIFFRIATAYQITDPQLLLDLVGDAVDPDDMERAHGSELALADSRFANGPIGSYARFMAILERYYELSGDKNVFLVPWREIFSFVDRLDLILDCERITPEARRFLGIEEEGDLCELAYSRQYRALAEALAIQKFSKKRSYIIDVQTRYTIEDLARDLRVRYDIVKGKIERID